MKNEETNNILFESIENGIEELEYIMFDDNMGSFSPYLGTKIMLGIISPILMPMLGIYHIIKRIKSKVKSNTNNIKETQTNLPIVEKDDSTITNQNKEDSFFTKYSYSFNNQSNEIIINEPTESYESKNTKVKSLKK